MRECPTAKSRHGRPWQGFCARHAEEPLPNGTPIEDAMSIGTKRHKQLIELLTGFAGLTIHRFFQVIQRAFRFVLIQNDSGLTQGRAGLGVAG
jgi:hypothetical protein